MAERYKRLFSLPEGLYAEGSPVVIAAGALLKDNQTGKVLAQLKLQSICEKGIKAASVQIIMKDVAGATLGEPVEHQYLDINVTRNQNFAQKIPIILPDNSTRGMEVSVNRVVFNDNSIWEGTTKAWEPLEAPSFLEEELSSDELVKQYKIKYGALCAYVPLEQKDLWTCSCGALNHQGESTCHKCHQALAALLAVDLDALRVQSAERVEKEKIAAEAALAEATALRKKKARNSAVIVAVALVICAVAAIFITKPARVMKDAREIAGTGDYLAAIAMLDELNKPEKTDADRAEYLKAMESEIQSAIADKDYAKAMALIEKYTVLDTAQENIAYIQKHCKHQLKPTESAEVSCTVDGFDRKVCDICDYLDEIIYPAPGHEFTSETTKEPTCTETGINLSVCTVCDFKQEEDIPVIAHSNKETTLVAATCAAKGIKQTVCTVCGKEEAQVGIAPLGHDYSKSVATAVGCTAEGVNRFTCTRCKDSYTETVKPTGHSWVEATCTAPKTCSGCGQTEGNALDHSWTASNGAFKCTRCSKTRMPTFNYTSNVPYTYEQWSDSGEELHGTAYFTNIRTEVKLPSGGGTNPVVSVYLSGRTTGDFVIETFYVYLYDSSGRQLDKAFLMINNWDPGTFSERVTLGGVHANYVLREDQTYRIKIAPNTD